MIGQNLLGEKQSDLEKDVDLSCCGGCCEAPDTPRRTWRKWARRNDSNPTFAYYTGVKWFLVVVFAIPVFLNHLVIGLIRCVSGGWFHMLCRSLCRFSNNECANACYYVIGGLPQVTNYLIAASEMIGLITFLFSAFWAAFGMSLLNPVCGVETCIELLRITDWTYSTIFANLPVALEHPGKLVMPCYFGDPYKSDAATVAPVKTATPSEEFLRAKLEAESAFAGALFPVGSGDQKRKRSAAEWLKLEPPLANVGLTTALVLDYKEGKRCSFWFIRAAKLRNFTGTTPPRMQELRRDHPEWLKQREISFADGYNGRYVSNTLVISHCWEHSSAPDGAGVQFAAIKEHLLANAAIEWVWFDFWSMPQGTDKAEVEDIEFSVMLPNINLLYLFCSVLILLDGSYMSRFWTQFEAFLSFRKVTANGLDLTPLSERRDAIKCIHNADSEFDPPKLRKLWGNKTADEAYTVLAKPDVKVTNQKDKDVQLPKLQKLDTFAKSVVADVVRGLEGWLIGLWARS